MGIEGQNSPRDVASENKKHPWEIFPEDESSTGDSEKKREQKKKKKENRAKRKMQLDKTKKWINTHHILILSIIIAVAIVISGGIIAIYKIKEKNDTVEVSDEEPSSEGIFPEDYKVDDAITVYQAFDYALTVRGVAVEGVENPYSDSLKVEDNMDLYVASLDTEYSKLYFRIFTAYILAIYNNPDRALSLLSLIEAEDHEFDKKQRYMFDKAYSEYYYQSGNTEKFDEIQKEMGSDPEYLEDLYVMIDPETGEESEDEEMTNLMKEMIRKELEGRVTK